MLNRQVTKPAIATPLRERIPWARPTLYGREEEYVVDALRSTWISGGPYLDRFERELAARLDSRFGMAVSSGTTALQLAYLALGIGPGDEVIVPAYTFVATASMAAALGATVVPADICPDTWLLDPESVARLVTPHTKAIVPVHLYGNVCDMDSIMAIARAHGIAVVEDNAESPFCRYKGRAAGSIGDLAILSFHAAKTITTGEGGMVLTSNPALHEKMLMLRDHGWARTRRYWHDEIGFNFRMSNLVAAIGCAQLEEIEAISAERQRVFASYRRELAGCDGIALQHFSEDVDPVLWMLALRLTDPVLAEQRDVIIEDLAASQIETRPGFFDLAEMPPFSHLPRMPNSTAVSRSLISLPTYPGLRDANIEYICTTLKDVLARRAQ
jgi:perosamine synthetase